VCAGRGSGVECEWAVGSKAIDATGISPLVSILFANLLTHAYSHSGFNFFPTSQAQMSELIGCFPPKPKGAVSK